MTGTMFPGTYRIPDYLMRGKTKICAKCACRLPIGHFAKDSRVKSGVRGSCRACSARYRSHRRAVCRAKG